MELFQKRISSNFIEKFEIILILDLKKYNRTELKFYFNLEIYNES